MNIKLFQIIMSSSLDNTNNEHGSTQNSSNIVQIDTALSTNTVNNTQNQTSSNLLHAGKFRDSQVLIAI
jgi:hypothetical protein